MFCPKCDFDNPDGSKFCGDCGNALSASCTHCGTQNPPGHKFCGECGQALTSDSTAGEWETAVQGRRFVSVLFIDLVGFTSFSEGRDPEEVREMLTQYFATARETIERFGGVIDKFIGDAVTAFWGATQAHEDDAERAVRAALELVDAVAEFDEEAGVPELRLRAGVLSGEAAVGTGGNRAGMIVGDIVNTAARLQAAAEPGTVLVGESTKTLTESAIEYEYAGEHELKGKSSLVSAWRALGVTGAVGGRGRTSGLEAPFVGRVNELRMLKDQVHATTREHEARLISIVGEAGIGKSRLAWELQKYLDGLAEVFRWHQGRSPAYGTGVTLWALGEMIRSRAGITETEEPEKAAIKLRTAVAEHVPDAEERDWIEPRLAAVLGLRANPSEDRRELFNAIRSFFQHMAGEASTIMVFEDLHWADESQLDFIEEFIEMSRGLPILVITLARPELLERRTGWGSAPTHFVSMRLGPMSDDEMGTLIDGLAPGIPEETISLIVRQAAGVPLYAVEYVRTLVNSGDLMLEGSSYHPSRELSELGVPDSLHAVIGARLDRLSPDDRKLVQDAAVLGQSFSIEGLAALTGTPADELEGRLRELVRAELFRFETDPRSPERGQYQFVQSLIREVAYTRLAKSERRGRHVAVAEYHRSKAPVEAAAVIASHYLDAYEADPDNQLAAQARESLMDAAHRAADLFSDVQALELAERALVVAGTTSDHVPIWSFMVRPATSLFRFDAAVDYATRSLEWYREHGTPAETVGAAATLGFAILGRESASEASTTMSPYYDPTRLHEPEMRRLGNELARAHMLSQDDLSRAAHISREVLEAAEDVDDMELVIEAMNTRGTAMGMDGRLYESIAMLREAVRLGEIHDFPPATMRAINNLSVIGWSNGLNSVREHTQRGYELAQRLGRLEFVTRMLTHRTAVLSEEGRFQQAIDLIDDTDIGNDVLWSTAFSAVRSIVEWQATGFLEPLAEARMRITSAGSMDEPQMRALMGDYESRILYLQGDPARALETALAGLPDALPGYEQPGTAIRAALELEQPEPLATVRDAMGAATGRRRRAFSTAAEAGEAAIQGRYDEAARMFDLLLGLIEDTEGPLSLSIWKAEMGRALVEHPEATKAAASAHDWFATVGAEGYLQRYQDVWQRYLPEDVLQAG